MHFTYEAVNSCTHVLFYDKHGLEEGQILKLILPLEIFTIVPFDDGVFELTNSISVAENLENAIPYCSWLTIIRIVQYVVCCWDWKHWWEPLYRININHTLHVEEVYRHLNRITLAYLIDWLHVGSSNNLMKLLLVHFKRIRNVVWHLGGEILILLQLLLLLLFVLVHPEDSWSALSYNVHLVIGAIFRHSLTCSYHRLVMDAYTPLLSVRIYVDVLASLSKFILETGIQAFV